MFQTESNRFQKQLGIFVGLIAIDVFKDGKTFPFSTFITVPQLLGNAELIFYPPALSFVELWRLPVDKLAQNLVTVLVTVVF